MFSLQNVYNVFFSWSIHFKRWTMFINHSRNLVVSGNIQRTITDPAAQCLIYSFIKQLQLSPAGLRVNQLVRPRGHSRELSLRQLANFIQRKWPKKIKTALTRQFLPYLSIFLPFCFPFVKKKSETVELLYVVQLKWSLWCLSTTGDCNEKLAWVCYLLQTNSLKQCNHLNLMFNLL